MNRNGSGIVQDPIMEISISMGRSCTVEAEKHRLGAETGGLHFEVAPLSMLVRPKLLWKYEKSRSDISETSSPVDVAFMPDDETTVVAEYDYVTDKKQQVATVR